MIKRLERLKSADNKYMADLRPTSKNGSWSKSTTRCNIFMPLYLKCNVMTLYHPVNILLKTTLTNHEGLFVPNTFHPHAIFGKWRPLLTSLRILRRLVTV
jgi:hypothetical protein